MSEVEFLRGLQFSWTRIAEIMGVSRSTLYRRLEDDGIDHMLRYSQISNAQLDELMVTIKSHHPNDGERMIIGHLHRLGVFPPRSLDPQSGPCEYCTQEKHHHSKAGLSC